MNPRNYPEAGHLAQAELVLFVAPSSTDLTTNCARADPTPSAVGQQQSRSSSAIAAAGAPAARNTPSGYSPQLSAETEG